MFAYSCDYTTGASSVKQSLMLGRCTATGASSAVLYRFVFKMDDPAVGRVPRAAARSPTRMRVPGRYTLQSELVLFDEVGLRYYYPLIFNFLGIVRSASSGKTPSSTNRPMSEPARSVFLSR
jgi:hypothetical protein